MARRPHYLSRSEIRQDTDKPTRSSLLRYTGTKLDFDSYIYGYPDGTFFAVQWEEVPWPPHLEELSARLGIAIDPLPEAQRLRQAVIDALLAGALVDAPLHMEEMDVEPEPEWRPWDLRELERKHRIAEARVVEVAKIVETDMKLRAASFKTPSFEMPKPQDFMQSPPPVYSPAPTVVVKTGGEPCERPEEVDVEEEVEVDDDLAYEPDSQTVRRIRAAVREAREQELPQRLPGGMRRRLKKVPPGAYIMYGEILDPRIELCGALTDGRALGRADREVVVVDYDGEWPVVVRRYGQDGRTIYKVETALRRYGIDVPDVE